MSRLSLAEQNTYLDYIIDAIRGQYLYSYSETIDSQQRCVSRGLSISNDVAKGLIGNDFREMEQFVTAISAEYHIEFEESAPSRHDVMWSHHSDDSIINIHIHARIMATKKGGTPE